MSCILKRISRSRAILSPLAINRTAAPSAGICHKDHIDPEIRAAKPAPWPYDRKKFTWFHQNVLRMDRCVRRFDENTVVICVEGPMAAGKHDFGVELAEQLGMRYYGEATVEPMMVQDNGFDFRTLNWLLPESAQHVDQKMVYLNPDHKGLGGFIVNMYTMKYFHYVEGLTHLYNTGQGVVHERSPFSDFIFHEALIKLGHAKKDLKDFYHDVYLDTVQMVDRPHLIIYLDIPAEESLRRFKQKSPDYIKNSPLVTLEYFQLIEDLYKKTYLPLISKHAEVLIYDWSEKGDMDLVVEDIEKLDFWQYEVVLGEKLEDWRHYKDEDYDLQRRLFSNQRHDIWPWFSQEYYDKPSMIMSQEAAELKKQVYEQYCPQYELGYDPKKDGFWKVLFRKHNKFYRIAYEDLYFGTSLRDKYTQLVCV